ncbi:phage holin family protein [Corynebacterium silvaticum]|uniref:Phage holin family protein n=1 Tax=Corynebacterium silvaticum TaxID=2320431 RepID=A0A7Y4P968_9CORY|nr:phage holin family protein [Corynebacterium silvaticum]ARU45745.1 phage holin family protein [Corynebacterium silvaticum]NON70289.1 phage holin family protein [Corynebacterium silvaticum]UWH00860.1 phage holin family protein [Corynebacterium silvaticum]UWH02907.1 phage holin family protein [Corynebacterium silvaticum]UWH04947.1 phage holin family protein [Corynebacterium silvaticum]
MAIHTIWHTIQTTIAGIGAWLAAYLGGLDGLVYALIVFAIADYITGVLAAISERRLSSSVGFRGISRKILIFTLVGLAHLIDVHVLGTPGVLRAAVIFFYLSNEGISLVENATRLGLPIPAQMRGALDAIANRAETRPSLTEPPTTENPTEKENH